MLLICRSTPSSIAMILRFCLLMVSQTSAMFYSYFSIFSWSFTMWCILVYLLSLVLYFQLAPLCSPRFWLSFFLCVWYWLVHSDWLLIRLVDLSTNKQNKEEIFIDFLFPILHGLLNFIHICLNSLWALPVVYSYLLWAQTLVCVSHFYLINHS
jgi:hypothetical protein